jgi:hypothetical protein
MGSNDGDNARNKENELMVMEHLFHDKHQDTKTENEYWTFSMVMFFEAMCKGIKPNSRSEQDHEVFEKLIIYHIYTEERQTC